MISGKHIDKATAVLLCLAIALSVFVLDIAEVTGAGYTPEYQRRLFGTEPISIDIQVDGASWAEMLANASAKEYVMADVVIDGVKLQSVGIRTKGNATLAQVPGSGSPQRYSLHIKFAEYVKKQTYYGLDALILNNMISDATCMKEYMAQDLMRFIGVEAPLTNYASISVNGEPFGFYVALEYYGKGYLNRIYGDKNANLYNVKTMQIGGGGAGGMGFVGQERRDGLAARPGADDWNDRVGFVNRSGSQGGALQYIDDDVASYSAIFDNAHGTVLESDQKKVIRALKNLAQGTDLEKYFDVDGILRYFAAHTVTVNLDSYYSNMAQNYFLQERDGQISILPWDYHLSYGAFQSGSAGDVVNAPIDTPVSGVTMEDRPLLDVLLSNEEYLAKYHGYLQEIMDGYFGSGLFEETVRNLQGTIGVYVKNDPSAFYTYEQFQAGVDAFVSLNLLRAESITAQLDGTIPATTDGQKADPSTLVDASSIKMSDLGSNNMGGRTQNAAGNMPEFGPGNIPGEGQFGPGGNIPNAPGGGPDSGPPGAGEQGQGAWGNRPGMLGGNRADLDMAKMREALEVIGSTEDGTLTDEQIEELHDLGLSDTEIEEMMQTIRGGFPGGAMQDQRRDPQAGNMQSQLPPDPQRSGLVASMSASVAQWTVMGVLLAALGAGTAFVALHKRRG